MTRQIKKLEDKHGYDNNIVQRFYLNNLEKLHHQRGWVLDEIIKNDQLIGAHIDKPTTVNVMSINPKFIVATDVNLTLSCNQIDDDVSKLSIVKQYMVCTPLKYLLTKLSFVMEPIPTNLNLQLMRSNLKSRA